LFLFGSNYFKQLGIEGVNQVSTITNDIFKNFKIDPKKFRKIICGNENNLILIEGKKKKKLKKKIKIKKKN
jgi:hypothetical protein